MRASRLWRLVALLLTLALVASACGDDDDPESTDPGGDEPAGDEINMDEELEIAEGTVLPLP